MGVPSPLEKATPAVDDPMGATDEKPWWETGIYEGANWNENWESGYEIDGLHYTMWGKLKNVRMQTRTEINRNRGGKRRDFYNSKFGGQRGLAP